MYRFPLLTLGFWRHYWCLLGQGFLFWGRSLKGADALGGIIGVALLIAGISTLIGTAISAWFQGLPWWVSAAIFLFLFLCGLVGASYEIKQEKDELEEKLASEEKRLAVKDLLGAAYEQATVIQDKDSNQEELERWVDNTQRLIGAAFGKDQARLFLSNSGITTENLYGIKPVSAAGLSFANSDVTWIDARLRRLDELFARIDTLNVRPGFDPQAFTAEVGGFLQLDPTIALGQSEVQNRRLREAETQSNIAARDRIALVHELYQLWENGDQLYRWEHPRHDLEDWEKRVSELARRALPKEKAKSFLQCDRDYAKWNSEVSEDDPKERIRMHDLLGRTKVLTNEVNRITPRFDLRPDFDMQQYRDWLNEQ